MTGDDVKPFGGRTCREEIAYRRVPMSRAGQSLGCAQLGEHGWQLAAEAGVAGPRPVGTDRDDVGSLLVDESIKDAGAGRGRDELDPPLRVDLFQLELFDHTH